MTQPTRPARFRRDVWLRSSTEETMHAASEELEETKKPMMCFSGKLELTDQELGRGAFGVIYKGVDPKTGMILVWLA